MSKLFVPCDRKLGIVRGTFPNVNAGGCANASVLNHRSIVGFSRFGLPTRFGRWFPPKEFVLFVAAVIDNGNPDFRLVTPASCQPPTTASTTAFSGATFRP